MNFCFMKNFNQISKQLSLIDDEAGIHGGFITKLILRLLSRCVDETDRDIRDAIACCLGEIGASKFVLLHVCYDSIRYFVREILREIAVLLLVTLLTTYIYRLHSNSRDGSLIFSNKCFQLILTTLDKK